jgi:hypothetical protein
MFAAAVDAADRDPKTAVCSPSLLGTSGVVTLTIISTIPDIMQHYHDVIVTAQKEVLIATNAWETGRSVDLVTSSFKVLNDRAAKDGRKVRLPSYSSLIGIGSCESVDGRGEYSQPLSIQIR